MRLCPLLISLLLVSQQGLANDQVWSIPYRSSELLLDGFLSDWEGQPSIQLDPAATGVQVEGLPAGDYATANVKAFWDQTGLYLAVDWRDDVWDIHKVKRSESVFVASDGRRRDRMYLYDNIRIQLRHIKYSYVLWASPRIDGQGPFYWQRLQRGGKFLERATHVPVITPRFGDGRATLEIMLPWKQIGLKPKEVKKKGLRAILTLADSDLPEMSVEAKLDRVGRLDWTGLIELGQSLSKK